MGRSGGWLAYGVAAAAWLMPMAALAGETQTYAYDALGRLIGISTSGTVNNGQSVTIGLDPAGNRGNYSVSGVTTPTISIVDATAGEGQPLSFTVTRTGLTTGAVSASYATVPGTALAGSDYTTKTGTVSFADGITSQTITVSTINDAVFETTETMRVVLSNPSVGAVIGNPTGTGTINDNDGVSLVWGSGVWNSGNWGP